MWMYFNWLEDHNEKEQLAKNHAYIIGSFINPEAVKQLIGDNKVAQSTDQEYEESLNIVKESAAAETTKRKRKRKIK
jgi:hypothetical protein